MTDEARDPFDQALAWLRAHEFSDAERLAPGSSVIDGSLLRGRVWSAAPAADDLIDLAGATPEGSWTIAVLVHEPEADLNGNGAPVAIMVLDAEHGMRPVNPLGHELLEWIGSRQRAKSFATRALHALAAERPEETEAAEEAPAPARPDGLPVRGQSPAVVRNAHGGPTAVTAATTPAPTPEPDPEPEPAPTAASPAAAGDAQRERIEDMRRQRELRKSFKKR